MPEPTSLHIERCLARAHMALWQAASAAEMLRDQSLCDDIYQIAAEVGRVNEDMLTGMRAAGRSRARRKDH